ncbi:YeiH family protein [Kordiimonas sp. A6E486]|nr:YeiH family protein [Kordiimonas marina]MCJ9429637.1 YeiH family protein [Kordiimonas marina]
MQAVLKQTTDYSSRVIPGLVLSILVTIAAYALTELEEQLTGHAWLEALVMAILIGTAVRSLWTPSERCNEGIRFSAKIPLEIAVVLLGLSLSSQTISAVGGSLLGGIAVVVFAAILISFALGRLLGLPARMALLVACGNSICGNSAIAAVAPVIGADSDDVAASIAFTAVLGVVVVLALPLLGGLLHMSDFQYGTLAGLTVYAVPQVLAAAAPLGSVAVHTGTLVKLVRVLMLGPVCVILAMLRPHLAGAGDNDTDVVPVRLPVHKLVPWFIIGFLVMAVVRSMNLVPDVALPPISTVTTLLTVLSMAALGLGVDVRVVARAGGRVTAAVVLSLLALGLISLGLIHLIGMA